ncbi:MAG TPA: glycosyltransferase [Solirubrobacteraceae bacterium]|jgi:glycosyltransferase involved in cell wall biosynthesis|nr:glycosyltransferase [Solirubrobacteraceae bacterium]
MPREIVPASRQPAPRGSVVVCVLGEGTAEGDNAALSQTLRSAAEHTPPEIPLWRFDPAPAGWGAALATLAPWAGEADLILVAAGALVGPGVVASLRDAAHGDDTVVSASALVGAPAPMLAGLRPHLAGLDARCVYLRREGIELLAPLGLDTPAAWSAAALERGLQHVLDADAAVAWIGPADGPPPADDTLDESGVLARTRALSRAARDGLWVTVDARALGKVATGGTQVYTMHVVLALARRADLRLRVLVPHDLDPQAVEAFAGLELVTYEQAARGEVERCDVVLRPQQVFDEPDLALLRPLGEAIVIVQHDQIAYRNPAYHGDEHLWRRYRRACRLAFDVADRVVFVSEHARRQALQEGLIDAERGVAVGHGADEAWHRRPASPRPPAPAPASPFLLCLGSDLAHKNRPFAIALLAELRARHGFAGELVLAGAHVPHGSSTEQERDRDPALPVIDLGPVEESERAWLLERAAAVIYPTLYEGYGMLPREAARAGVPCLYAPVTALLESAGARAATLVPWDAAASAAAVAPLLQAGPAREAHVALLRERTATPSWDEIAERLRDVLVAAIAGPRRGGAARAWQELPREAYLDEVSRALAALRDDVGALAGPENGGLLDAETRRGLVRIAARPALRRLLLAPVRLLGRPRRR